MFGGVERITRNAFHGRGSFLGRGSKKRYDAATKRDKMLPIVLWYQLYRGTIGNYISHLF